MNTPTFTLLRSISVGFVTSTLIVPGFRAFISRVLSPYLTSSKSEQKPLKVIVMSPARFAVTLTVKILVVFD